MEFQEYKSPRYWAQKRRFEKIANCVIGAICLGMIGFAIYLF